MSKIKGGEGQDERKPGASIGKELNSFGNEEMDYVHYCIDCGLAFFGPVNAVVCDDCLIAFY